MIFSLITLVSSTCFIFYRVSSEGALATKHSLFSVRRKVAATLLKLHEGAVLTVGIRSAWPLACPYIVSKIGSSTWFIYYQRINLAYNIGHIWKSDIWAFWVQRHCQSINNVKISPRKCSLKSLLSFAV